MHVRYALNIVVGTRTSVAVVSSFDTFQVLIVGCAGLKKRAPGLLRYVPVVCRLAVPN